MGKNDKNGYDYKIESDGEITNLGSMYHYINVSLVVTDFLTVFFIMFSLCGNTLSLSLTHTHRHKCTHEDRERTE